MRLILNNPYRILGLLVGAKAKEQDRQTRRLRQFIEAEEVPDSDFSFPLLGDLQRTSESINTAASRLNLDSDKMNAALFWFYLGNSITDEPAFDALKDGDLNQVVDIWSKLIESPAVSQRNASAFNNLSTLYLSGILNGTDVPSNIVGSGISLKLKFLESDLARDFKGLATDSTFQATNKELQIMFLKELQSEIDGQGIIGISDFFKIIINQEFSAKTDFLKGFVEKPIELLEKQITECKSKRKKNKADALAAGKLLYGQSFENLALLKSTLTTSNSKYSSISDKVSEEILQCGIDYFLFHRDSTNDPGQESMDLFKLARHLALGNIANQRCQENTDNLQEWINGKPEREKQKSIKAELEFIAFELESFQTLPETVNNAKDLIDSCKSKIAKIKTVLGTDDDLYLKLSSAVVQNAQNMLVAAVNEEVEGTSNNPHSIFSLFTTSLNATVESALDTTFKIGTFDMHPNLRIHYSKNLDGIKSLAKQLRISTLSPKERVQEELKNAEINLRAIPNQIYYELEMNRASAEMKSIKEWQLFRSQSEREQQIKERQQKIDEQIAKNEEKRASQIQIMQRVITEIKGKLQQIEY